MNPNECQFPTLQTISEGKAKAPHRSPVRNLTLLIRRHLNPRQDRALHRKADSAINFYLRMRGNNVMSAVPAEFLHAVPLKAGDTVRVRSVEEIRGTLNHMGQLKGCAFMDAMEPFCGTVQRVLKPMERFVDERDLKVKKCSGLILLEGVMCGGVTAFGRCDRSCFIFWREEWLEKIG